MICAIALIDPGSTERLSKLRRLTTRFGIPPRDVHGHITLASYIGGDEDGFISSCKAILSRYGAFSVPYDRVEIFDSSAVIVASPRKDGPLDAMQKDISEVWAAGLNEWTRRDMWRPHTSLFYSRQVELEPILKAMRKVFEPFAAQVDQIEFSYVDEEDRIKTIDRMKLP